ncbi:hypothetical protein DINM_000271 [Dirofilaria immitis]|nr:hypothetical protein [Dirofilaria immitis]
MNWLALIVGKAGSGKSTAVRILASLLGKKLHTMHLTSESDSLELLGSFEQVADYINFTSIKQHCLNLLKRYPDLSNDVNNAEDILTLRMALQSAVLLVDEDTASNLSKFDMKLSKSKVRFEWLNSRFVDAFINGYWILVENVNCCSAAVLDRLNACLENNGELNLQECGDGTSIVKAHSDFRVFFTMDDDYGDVSRAMRNRSVELYLLPDNCAWFKVAQDLVNMVMDVENQDILRITPAIMQACTKLSCWELLKLKILLKEKDMNFENAIKYFKISMNEETMEIDEIKEETFIVYPTIDVDIVATYSKWKVLVWSYVSRDDWILGVLWAAFCVSFRQLKIEEMVELFKYPDEKIRDEVIEAIQNLKQNKILDYDERFDGSPTLRISKLPDTYTDNNRFIIGMCALWTKFNLDKIPTKKGSAADMSNLFAKKKIRSDQLPSPAISYLKELLDELYMYISKFSLVDYSVSDSCSILWNIILFVKACHQRMDLRSACAPLHLAWQRLNDSSCSNIWKKQSKGLRRITTAIDEVWMTDKKLQNFTPISTNAYEDELENLLINSATMENENCLMPQNQTGNCNTGGNSILSVLKLMREICCGFAILNNHNGKQILLDLLSISSHHPIGLCRLALLNLKDENWSQIAHFTQYLNSEFAVEEIAIARKNSDLAWITLGTELFSSLWRSMGFQFSSQEITLRNFYDFPMQRKHLCFFFWKIGVHLKSFKLKYKEKLLTVIDHFESLLDSSFSPNSSDVTLSGLMRRLEITVCTLLSLSVPAKNCIDPVMNNEMNFNYLMNKKKLLENIIDVLLSYQGVISGQMDLALFSNSEHPFISSLLNIYNSVIKELGNYSQNTVSYRPRYTDFSSLATTMNSFLETVLEQHRAFSIIDLDHLDNISDDNIRMAIAQIDSFLTSIQSFYDKTFAEYSAFTDVICPFFMFLNILVATVSHKRFHLIQLMNLRNLIAAYNFPSKFSKELVVLCLQNHKQDTKCFANPKDIMVEKSIEWIKNEWSKWFEANTEKQDKTYIYRKSTKYRDDGLDEDDIKIREFLPDFSTSGDEQDLCEEPVVFAPKSTSFIDSDSLTEILYLLANEKYVHGYNGHMALAWLIDIASSCGLLDDLVDSKFFVYNLHALNQFNFDKDTRIVDVYRKNSLSELEKCIAAMKPLIKRVYWLKEKWPEVTVLDSILQRAHKILSASMEIPQMQFSALLERLLAEADLWEKVADRNHSLAIELEELRHLLVNWRKMEVLCWDNLLEQVQTDCRAQTLLLARLLTTELLITFIKLTKGCVRCELCQRLKSVVAYFRQFDVIIENKLAAHKEPIEKQLHDFVKIMKYNDLNLWSVKNSAQKAHKQLFRLLKQFRISGSDLIAPLFDKIPPTLSSIGHETKAIFANDRIISCNDFYAKRAVDLTLEIVTHLMDGIHFETIQELTEYVKYCNDLVRKDIQYEGDNSEKEKQQGRALSERQKAVARLFKNNGTVGLSSRKGLTVNAEQLTANVVAGMPGEDTMLAKFIRHGGTLRNIVLKNFHKPNTQIGAKTMSQLKGLTEFVLNELYLCHQTVTSMREMLEKIDKAKKMLLNYLANAKDAKQSWLCGQQWLRRLQQLKYSTLKFNSLLEFMRTKLENAPECNTDSEENMILKFSGIEDTRLSQLYKQHKEYDITLDAIRKTQDATGRLLEAIQWSLLQSVGCDSIAIWKSSDISRTIDIVKSECTNINSHLSLISYVMAEEVDEAMGIIREVLEALANPTNVREAVQDISWEGIQALLIIIQNTYKQAMLIDLNSSRFMDVLRQLINLLRSLNFDKSTEAIWNLCAQLSKDNGSVKPNDLEQVVAISSTCYEILSFILGLAENSAIELAKYYMHFEAMAASLLEKLSDVRFSLNLCVINYLLGLYKSDTKAPKEISENDEGQLQSFDDDIAGLGDAKGDKDVGNDIDETGQVEGLRGDEENVDEGTDKNQNDSTPLDMDDDFGGCLEDIDREQGGDSEENDEGEDGEPEADMEMGDVNQSEEDKLDSDLWNQDDDSEKELAEGNEGNMTADNDEWDSKTDKDDKDANVDDDDNRDDKDADANDDLENMDERELLDNGRDNQNPGQVDEYNVDSNSSENKSEDDMEHVMNDKLDESDEQSEDDVEEEMQTEMIEENEEKIQEDFLDEINDAAVVQLNKDDDEVLKGGAGEWREGGGRYHGQKCYFEPESAEMESRGGIGHEESEDNNTRNEKLENLKKMIKNPGKRRNWQMILLILLRSKFFQEQIVIDKSSIEEARISKGNRDQLRDLKNINVKQNDEEIMDDNIENRSELNENDLSDTDIWNSDFQNPIIHSTTDFYHLTERSVSTNTLDADEAISSSIEAEERWNRISDSVSVLAAELSENLRMIIEPTVASRFEGDYRTGKRLNMRRLIAYIASGYRKDKIWLRRTKKAQHNYQILIAVDDSASMHDNQIKLKACQSVAMIESGLRRLEIGQLAICKFGASVKMISDFGNYDGSGLGGKLISELNFSQDRTDLVSLLKCSKKIFEQARGRERNDQMLIIVSDGRGVLADGAEAIKKSALAELHADQVIVLFVAIDNGEKSIMDMKVAEFTIDGNVNLTPYLQKFPFPFYMVVGRVAMLPATIGDAIRQWFELTARDS